MDIKKNYYTIYAPYNSKIIVWKNIKINIVKVNIITTNKVFKLVLEDVKFFLDKWSNSIVIDNNKPNALSLKLNNFINNFLNSWDVYYFNKIKFKGKGFRIKFFKKIKLIKFYFGRSHKTFIILKKIKKKKISKYKFILFCLNKNRLINTSKIITEIKKINFYTLRGLRSSRQIILKRKGKKGTYI